MTWLSVHTYDAAGPLYKVPLKTETRYGCKLQVTKFARTYLLLLSCCLLLRPASKLSHGAAAGMHCAPSLDANTSV